MWLNEERSRKVAKETAAECGPVTISEPAAVYLAGERRQVPVCCPGGYAWRPKVGEEVLVLKAGGQEEQPFILGTTQNGAEELEPGELRLGGEDNCLFLGEELRLTGTVVVNGEELTALIRRVIREMLGLPEEEEEEKG